MDCNAIEEYEKNKSEYWLSEYTAKITYVSVLNSCNYISEGSYRTVKQLFENDKTFIRGGLYIANIEYQLGQRELAKSRLMPMVEHHEELVEPWLLLAKIAMKEGKKEDAKVFIDAARVTGNKTEMIDAVTQELML